ncbi:hypothetical protein J8273_2079 [Carpediemonas membranifera]|uniref:Uncharacterized protein n=1 Tax=Carpediemonas membranifera TaxID=201153 RepID=A0A8J6B5X9_9EUKA|nr:hypothetical protein J8273_2079 [Carpediemonas membranifera]|eukprot:KAG9396348.1 hypothetical protein J8273_2079 [Carpediemonas membranifera]
MENAILRSGQAHMAKEADMTRGLSSRVTDCRESFSMTMDAQEALQRLDAHIALIDADIAQLNGMMLIDEDIDARIVSLDRTRARLAAMRSSEPKSGRDIQRDAMIGLHSVISRDYAFTHEFGEELPDEDAKPEPVTTNEVASALMALDLHHRSAICFVNRIVAFLYHGRQLSMNVELADGEDLPVAMHTLNQGAVWACLGGGGANPDLWDRVQKKALSDGKKQSHIRRKLRAEMHNKICKDLIPKGLAPTAKYLWFLCRKFFFSLNVAEKDGESYQYTVYDRCYHHRMYMGRLFMLDTMHRTALTRARMPRALEVYSHEITHIARTPKGLWGWGQNGHGQLGSGHLASTRPASPFPPAQFVEPTHLTITVCPKVAELEASLPPWEKHTMVTDVSIDMYRSFILTTVGTVMAGDGASWFIGFNNDVDDHDFYPIAVPAEFVPDHIMQGDWTVVLSMGDRQMISVLNKCGQLGLGHKHEMTGFEELPFRVDRIMVSDSKTFNVFLSGRQLHFAGEVPAHIFLSGLLPGFNKDDNCLTASPLRFPERVRRFYCDPFALVWVIEGQAHVCQRRGVRVTFVRFGISFEATAFIGKSFCDQSGQWFEMSTDSDEGGEMVECDAPGFIDEISIVYVDPWTAGVREETNEL